MQLIFLVLTKIKPDRDSCIFCGSPLLSADMALQRKKSDAPGMSETKWVATILGLSLIHI